MVEKDKDTMIETIKGTAEAIKMIQTDGNYTKKVMSKWMPMKDADLLEQAYLFAPENYAQRRMVPRRAARDGEADGPSNLVDAKTRRSHAGHGLL